MKRRGFLGVLGGAAVAGPGAAKQAVTAAQSASLGGVARAGAIGGALARETPVTGLGGLQYDHKNYLMQRVAELKRRISGELTDEEREERRVQNDRRKVRFEIETGDLRSMAEGRKFARMARFAEAQDHERERFYARRSLAEVLKELAGMGS